MKRAFTVAGMFWLALAALAGSAQTRPDFSGQWVLHKAKSKEHRPAQFRRQTMEVVHSEPNLEVSIRAEQPKGREFRAYLDFKTDGTPAEVVLGAVHRVVARWESSKLLIRWNMDTRTRSSTSGGSGRQGATPPFLWTWTLSEDGSTLTNQTHVFEDAAGEIRQTLVFTKVR